jgi:cysteine desulfurase
VVTWSFSRVEHAAVREAARRLEFEGFEVTPVEVDHHGLVDPGAFAAALRPDTALAAVVWANNEVGTVEPVCELAEICAEREVPFHTDAVQAAGRVSLDAGEASVSTLALSAHKLYGPQGVGALYVREGVSVQPISYGGGQERGLRSGTQNVAGIVGFGAAAQQAREELDGRVAHERELRDTLIAGVARIPDVRLNGHPERRLSNNVHLTVDGVEAESLVLFLDALGYAIGSGSACSSGEHKASLYCSPWAGTSGRLSRSSGSRSARTIPTQRSRGFLEASPEAVTRLRELSPLYANKLRA